MPLDLCCHLRMMVHFLIHPLIHRDSKPMICPQSHLLCLMHLQSSNQYDICPRFSWIHIRGFRSKWRWYIFKVEG
ncbi:Uncharacterized protein TCM_009578 isoform 2 [Theobroma cacao]|uniref:Uncharacterized protein isoform 2 n=1 Tax=Theobroma cacao TaxID=3641 RepID=A0A061E638_THECC|nr:Uncharacterized protein TCM_009578 isoform 2 [Theobroma cacao]EOY00093.1 Uncharacterized protein TCM_009578 isoform 2 [Theobroma cacao]